MITGHLPSLIGRYTSQRSTTPSSILIGTSQSMRMPSRISELNSALISPPPRAAIVTSKLAGARRVSHVSFAAEGAPRLGTADDRLSRLRGVRRAHLPARAD